MAYSYTIMTVVDSPPPTNHLVIRRSTGIRLSSLKPWLVRPNKVYHIDT